MELSWKQEGDVWLAGFTIHSSFKKLPDDFFLFQIASDNLFKPFDQHYIVKKTLTEFIEKQSPRGFIVRVVVKKDKDYSEIATYRMILNDLSDKYGYKLTGQQHISSMYFIISQEPPPLLNLISYCETML